MAEVENLSAEASVCSSPTHTSSMPPPPLPPLKKKRNLPGTPGTTPDIPRVFRRTGNLTQLYVYRI